ncbi:MAG: DNA recombination protein RmuC, partial [Acidobacteria bacterium]|nr:DNA recombination protein RmuC [Acidobacteriota bacterium]
QHAANLRRHIDSLSRKDYQEYVQKSLGKSLSFTILFISGEHFLSSAMITDAGIFEYAASKNIVLASPTILVPLLKALNSGWKAEELEENAQKSIELAAELYSRFLKVFEHIQGVGKSLNQAVSRYNEAMRSIDSRLVPAARQIEERIDARRTMEETQKIDRLALEAAKVEVLESLSRLASESDDEESGEETP